MFDNENIQLNEIDASRQAFLADFEKTFGLYHTGIIRADIPVNDNDTDTKIIVSDDYSTDSGYLIRSTMKLAIETINLPYSKLLFYMIPVPFGGGKDALVLREFTYTIICPRSIPNTLIFTDKKKYTGRVGFFNTAVKIKDINGFKPIPEANAFFDTEAGLQLAHNLHRYRMLPQVIGYLAEAKKQAGKEGLPRTALTDFMDKSTAKILKKLKPLNKFKLPMRLPIRFKDDQGFQVVLAGLNDSETIIQIGDFDQNPDRALHVLNTLYEQFIMAPRK